VSAVRPAVAGDPAGALATAAVNAIRSLSMDAIERARSGHPGLPLAMAPAAFVLYARIMRHDADDPTWPDRDRFVLSAGHGSMLLYSVLHLAGYQLPLSELRRFRQWGSRTPGHPERMPHTAGVETTTGPLGQGFANGVGMAMAERFLRERYGAEVMNHRIYGICSDGDLMEGVSAEAASLAGHLGLGSIVYLYDDNRITIDGPTRLAFSGENVDLRFQAYGWHTSVVEDANDLEALESAIVEAHGESGRPSLIRVRSVIGWPAPTKAGTAAAHGAPLGPDEVRATKLALGLDPDEAFAVPDGAYAAFAPARSRGAAENVAWRRRVDRFRAADAAVASEWDAVWNGEPIGALDDRLPRFDRAEMSTRAAGGEVMQAFAPLLPTMLGGAADLVESTKTTFAGEASFSPRGAGRNVHWGVREHGMGAAVNGMALHGGIVKPYGSTFLVFADYMRPAIRMSAIMGLPVVWVFTHDSVGVGEDGPTHQPVEHYAALRAIPGLTVIRPADAYETAEAWRVALATVGAPVCLLLTRQDLPVLDRGELGGADQLERGAYVLADGRGGGPDAVVVATGSEVAVALAARAELSRDGIEARVVSMPSWELFEGQPRSYRESVLPPGVATVSLEAGVAQGWSRYATRSISIERFGASAPGPTVFVQLGITPEAVCTAVRSAIIDTVFTTR